MFTRRLCFGGLAGALVFFCLSMTPSLVPRAWLFQGLVSGAAAAIGYGLGSFISSAIRYFLPREPSKRFKRIAWWVLIGATLLVGGYFMWRGAMWQEDVRRFMEMDQLRAYEWFNIAVSTLVVALFILMIARFLRGGTRALIRFGDGFLPHAWTVGISLGIVAALSLGFAHGVLFEGAFNAINNAYSLSDRDTSPWISQPTSELRTGGPGSVVEWDTLGTKGRDFVGIGGGPTVEDIEAFTGEPAMEPIRVYVGLDSAEDVRDRVKLAVEELDRTGAFDREFLIVNTTTGTGWVDENVADSIEFLHGGDTAQVAMQYSFLPSWVSFLVDTSKAEAAGEQMITAIVDRLNDMAPEDRPTLLVFGESLGSFGTEAAFTSPENMLANADGALLVGPTFVNQIHTFLTGVRNDGSPAWRPQIEDGSSIRFAVSPADLTDPELIDGDVEWEPPRVVYLQNSSDPITYFNPELLLKEPEWLKGEHGPDVSPDMIWIPGITFFQVAADMAFSMDVPAGHGHRYGSNVVDGWVELSAPDGWTDADTEALRALIDERADERNARKEAAS